MIYLPMCWFSVRYKQCCEGDACAGVPEDMLYDVGKAITALPEGFNSHRQIQKVYAARKEMVSSPESLVDWGMAEALAFGTLVAEGNHVRLSGQACSSLQYA